MLPRTLPFLVVYALAAWLGRTLMAPGSQLALFWPASGVGALWALTARNRRELALIAGLVVAVLMPVFVLTQLTVGAAVMLTIANLMLTIGLRLVLDASNRLRRLGSRLAWEMHDPTDVSIFTLVACLLVVLSLAFAMPGQLFTGHPVTADAAAAHFFRNMGSIVVLAGTGAAWLNRRWHPWQPSPLAMCAYLGSTALIAAMVYGPAIDMPLGYMLLMPLFWSAIRLPPWGAMAHATITCALALVLTLVVGTGPFGPNFRTTALAARLQLFCLVCGQLALVISVAMEKSRRLASELATAEQTARQDAARLATVTETVPDGLALVLPGRRIQRLNQAVAGYLEGDDDNLRLPAQPLGIDGNQLSEQERPCTRALAGTTVRDQPVAVVQPDGTRRVFEVSATPMDGLEDHSMALLSFRDATARFEALEAREAVETELAHQARHDFLTGLMNRMAFEAELDVCQARWAADGIDCGLLLIDLDNFKDVNDTLGHSVGDELLISVGKVLRAVLRSSDVVARLGGDEFAVLLPGADLSVAKRVGQDVVDHISFTTRQLSGEQRRVTASIGAISLSAAQQSSLDPMVLADLLMYEAKDCGRNTVAAPDLGTGRAPRMGVQLAIRHQVEHALAHGGFELYLQPLLDIRTGRVSSAEALLRLNEDGLVIPPSDFMPVVERTGLSTEVDVMVLREALRISQQLRASHPHFILSANVAGPSVGNPQYMSALTDALAQMPVPEGRFILEITETTTVGDMERAKEFTREVRSLGIGLALDDFGAGFGSFSYLKHLDFSYLKIDGQFVKDLVDSPVDQSIVRSFVQVAHDLGRTTVAEHVATPEVFDFITALGVDKAQGYHVGRPLPVAEFVRRHLAPHQVVDTPTSTVPLAGALE